ncbi:PorP/SprF family type IX secretion system membrane protein [Flavobacterium sp. XS1P32]|uniref:PorP/SprF family type IX secretion system membrane protein n=1 Tax=Flavobacterium sp. XS1P32 TaxID=3401726 RepID=UPI003AAD4FEA
MKSRFLIFVFFFCSLQALYSQEGGVASFDIPVRNSMRFNKFLLNPAFSFAREQNSYITLFNKREWVQFDNAPQTYLVSYSGRFRENQGVSLGVFQQNYGVLTTFGGVANFAQNVYLDQDSNLTFGVNLGFYKSGINTGKVITNYPDPTLETIPSNSLFTLSPGINYGNAFFDFGLAVKNAVLFNLQSSNLVQDDPSRSIQAHLMYTGFIDSYGFFDKSKFSGLIRAESKKEQTIVSGLVMFSIPKGIWAQAGYNSFHGVSGGIGINVTPRIALEYNYEKALGNFSQFGPSHELVLAYKFKSDYSDDDEDEGALIPAAEDRRAAPSKAVVKPTVKSDADIQRENELKVARQKAIEDARATADALAQTRLENAAKAKALFEENRLKREKIAADAAAKAKAIADAKVKPTPAPVVAKPPVAVIPDAKAIADAKVKADAAAKAKLAAAAKAKADADAKARLAAGAKAKADADAKLAADAKVKADTDAKAKLEADAKAKLAADAKAKADADARAKLSEEAKAKLVADAKVKADADAKAKLEADAKAKADAEARAKLSEEAKAKADADAKAKADADAQAKLEADAKAKLAADAKAKADADAKAKADADAKAKLEADARAKLSEEAKAKADADAKVKADSDAKAKLEADAKTKLAADAKAKADADAKSKLEADAKAKADADAKAKADADAKAKADADAQAKLEADAKAKLAADAKAKADSEAKAKADAKAKLAADAKAKADADAQAKLAADAKAKADADAKAKLEADAKVKLASDAKAKADSEAKAKADVDAKLAADAKVKADADAKAKQAADAKAKADAEAKAKLDADAKAKLAADAKAKADAEAKAKADADLKAKLAADAKAKADAEAKAKLEADAKAKLAADAKAKADSEAKAKLEADAKAKLAADAKAKADADAKAKLEADAKAKLAADAKAKADSEAKAKAKADAEAKAKLEADAEAKAKLEADAKAKLAADAKAKADSEAKAKADADAKLAADAKAKLDAEAKAKAEADALLLASTRVKDENAKTMDNVANALEKDRRTQQQLLTQLNEKVSQKQKELKELKDENDLNDQGIASAPKEYKSISAEASALESLKSEIQIINANQNQLLTTFKNLYEERTKKVPNLNDSLTQSYLKTINELKAEQAKAELSNTNLLAALEKINVETQIEKKRRIKRANFENEDTRYLKDQETLKRIKATTFTSTVKAKPEDFDFGNEQVNMQIIKNIKNVETGYYIVLAVHADVAKRDTFVTKTVSTGEKNVNFFYDVKSTNYYIYTEKFDNLQQATTTLESRGTKPYNGKMVIIKVEN